MGLTLFLLLAPIIVIFLGIFIYKFQGKKDLLHLDLVQFVYTFVLAPLLFIWFKTFFFFLLKTNGSLSSEWLFVLDTVFTMVLFYLYAFIVMHSLTKTFRLKSIDPLYDFFYHSEYIHLWLSHLVMVGGSVVLLVILGFLNLFFSLTISFPRYWLVFLLIISFFLGFVGYVAIMMADPKQKAKMSFTRLVKLMIAGGFLVLMSGFFILTPQFTAQHLLYWFILTFFAGMVTIGLFSYRSAKVRGHVDSLVYRLVHFDWGKNDQVVLSSKIKQKN